VKAACIHTAEIIGSWKMPCAVPNCELGIAGPAMFRDVPESEINAMIPPPSLLNPTRMIRLRYDRRCVTKDDKPMKWYWVPAGEIAR